MIDLDIHFNDLASRELFHHLRKKFVEIPTHARIQDAAAILGDPDDMIFGSINAVPENP
jgi:hypothetical protein